MQSVTWEVHVVKSKETKQAVGWEINRGKALNQRSGPSSWKQILFLQTKFKYIVELVGTVGCVEDVWTNSYHLIFHS